MPIAEVAARWIAIDLTGTIVIYTGGAYTPPELVYSEQLDRVLSERGECLALTLMVTIDATRVL